MIYLCRKIKTNMRLSELQTGEKGVIIKVMGHGGFRRRIIEMGFIKGKTVEVLLKRSIERPYQIQKLWDMKYHFAGRSCHDRSDE